MTDTPKTALHGSVEHFAHAHRGTFVMKKCNDAITAILHALPRDDWHTILRHLRMFASECIGDVRDRADRLVGMVEKSGVLDEK